MQTTTKMNRKPVTFTYAVTFQKDVWYRGNAFIAGVEYVFKARSESSCHGDMFDNAWSAIYEMLGCLKNNKERTMKRILHINDPIIKSWEEAEK